MSSKPAKVVGVLSIIAGLVMIVAGAVTWFTVSSQLAEENITVPKDAPFLAGAKVAGPFTAFAQAETIKKHALAGSDGKTYAELGGMAREAQAAAEAAKTAGDTAKEAEQTELAAKYTAQRTQVMNGSFLRASLFTSVVAYGVAALVMGLGIMFALIGWALGALAKPAPVVAKE